MRKKDIIKHLSYQDDKIEEINQKLDKLYYRVNNIEESSREIKIVPKEKKEVKK